nr:MAG: RNA-dependent RNA polymerase [Beetle nodavirus]
MSIVTQNYTCEFITNRVGRYLAECWTCVGENSIHPYRPNSVFGDRTNSPKCRGLVIKHCTVRALESGATASDKDAPDSNGTNGGKPWFKFAGQSDGRHWKMPNVDFMGRLNPTTLEEYKEALRQANEAIDTVREKGREILTPMIYNTLETSVCAYFGQFTHLMMYEVYRRWLDGSLAEQIAAAAKFSLRIINRDVETTTIYSMVVDQCVVRYVEYDLTRISFARSFRVVSGKANPSVNHSHAEAANTRTQARTAMSKFCSKVNKRPYWISASRAEFKMNNEGSRNYYTMKDTMLNQKQTVITSDHILCSVDVDYYLDLNYYCSYGLPLLLFTFCPVHVTGNIENGVFNVDGDRVRVNYSGGAQYEHGLWNYNADLAVTTGWWYHTMFDVSFYCIPNDVHRKIVLLTPKVSVPRLLRVPYPEHTQMKRWSAYKVGKYNLLKNYKQGGTFISLGDGSGTSVEIPLNVFDECRRRVRLTKEPLASTVEAILRNGQVEDVKRSSMVVYDFLRNEEDLDSNFSIMFDQTTSVGEMIPHYIVDNGIENDDGSKPKIYAKLVGPLITTQTPAAPAECKANDTACIQGRLYDTHNTKKFSKLYKQYADEFVEQVVPDDIKNTVIPYSLEQVRDIQTKPLQRARNNRCLPNYMYKNLEIKAFQKKEVYGSVKAPRNIASCNVEHTLAMCRYVYAVKEHVMKNLKFYGPCQTPEQIANTVSRLAEEWLAVASTDFEVFDGSHSVDLRTYVEMAVYVRAIVLEHVQELKELMYQSLKIKCRTKNGVVYFVEGQRPSGEPTTTDGNTINNAFNSYCRYRNNGYSPKEAFDALGIYYGDDGLDNHIVPKESYFKTCADLGLSIKLDISEKGEPIEYLGRVWYAPTLNNQSMQNPMRTIVKLPVTCHTGSSDEQQLLNRVNGYLVSDKMTPVIGNYCAAIVRTSKENWRKIGIDKETLFKLEDGSWPGIVDTSAAVNLFAKMTKLETEQVWNYMHLCDAARHRDDMPPPLDVGPIQVKIPAIIKGEVFGPNPDPGLKIDAAKNQNNTKQTGKIREKKRPRPRVSGAGH